MLTRASLGSRDALAEAQRSLTAPSSPRASTRAGRQHQHHRRAEPERAELVAALRRDVVDLDAARSPAPASVALSGARVALSADVADAGRADHHDRDEPSAPGIELITTRSLRDSSRSRRAATRGFTGHSAPGT